MIASKLFAFILLVIGIVQAIPLDERNEASSAGLEAQSNKGKVCFSFLFLFCHCWRLSCTYGQLTAHLNPRLLFAKPMARRSPSQKIMPKICTKRLPRARMWRRRADSPIYSITVRISSGITRLATARRLKPLNSPSSREIIRQCLNGKRKNQVKNLVHAVLFTVKQTATIAVLCATSLRNHPSQRIESLPSALKLADIQV